MILKVIVCLLLVFWCKKRSAFFLPAVIYAALTFWAVSSAQALGVATSAPVMLAAVGFAVSAAAFWLIVKTEGTFLQWIVMAAACAVLFLYPIDPAMFR